MKHCSLLANIVFATLPLLMVLPGCGGGSGGPNPNPTPTVTPLPTATTTASPIPTTTTTFRPVREFYVSVSAAQITEGDSGQKQLQFTVTGTDTYGERNPLSFSYQTLDGTASAGQDYVATSGQGTVTTGSTTTISVPIIGDTVAEADEYFTLRIFNAQGLYRVTERLGTILNDD